MYQCTQLWTSLVPLPAREERKSCSECMNNKVMLLRGGKNRFVRDSMSVEGEAIRDPLHQMRGTVSIEFVAKKLQIKTV